MAGRPSSSRWVAAAPGGRERVVASGSCAAAVGLFVPESVDELAFRVEDVVLAVEGVGVVVVESGDVGEHVVDLLDGVHRFAARPGRRLGR